MIVRTDPATRAAVERVGIETHLAAIGPSIAIAIGKARLTETIADTRGASQGLHMVVGAERAAAAAVGWVVVEVHLAPVPRIVIAVRIPGVAGHAACIIGTGRNRILPRWASDAAATTIVGVIGGGNAGVATESIAGWAGGLADSARTNPALTIRTSPAESPDRTLRASATAIDVCFVAVLHAVGASRCSANPAETNPADAVVCDDAGSAIRTPGAGPSATIDVCFTPILHGVSATRGPANPAGAKPADAVIVDEAGTAIHTLGTSAAAAIDVCFTPILHGVKATCAPANPSSTNSTEAVVVAEAGAAISTLGAGAAAAIDVRFAPILHRVGAICGPANPSRTDPADAVSRDEARPAIRTLGARAAAIHIRFGPIFDSIDAGRSSPTDTAEAHTARTGRVIGLGADRALACQTDAIITRVAQASAV